jgi:ribosomal protein S18 acetylase RimI-like enzyme
MQTLQLRPVEAFPEPAFSELVQSAFADYAPSDTLAAVLEDEAQAASGVPRRSTNLLRVAAFLGDTLVGWSQSRIDADATLHMINSGVAPLERRRGIYSQLVRWTIAQAGPQGGARIDSRHAASNSAVIVAKLKLGFVVSGFEYSEVYGPLVRLTYLVHDRRRQLYAARARPLRRATPGE